MELSKEQFEEARKLQPELQHYLAHCHMHIADLTIWFAMWHIEKIKLLESQKENLVKELNINEFGTNPTIE